MTIRDFSSASARAVVLDLLDLVGGRAARLVAHLVVEPRLGLRRRQPGDLLQPRPRLDRLRGRRARRRLRRRLAPGQLLLAARRLVQPLLEPARSCRSSSRSRSPVSRACFSSAAWRAFSSASTSARAFWASSLASSAACRLSDSASTSAASISRCFSSSRVRQRRPAACVRPAKNAITSTTSNDRDRRPAARSSRAVPRPAAAARARRSPPDRRGRRPSPAGQRATTWKS